MRAFAFTLTEHDAGRPWIVVGREHRTVELEDGADFFSWALQRWPKPRWTIELDPWQLSPERPVPGWFPSPNAGKDEETTR
jgi:hypothetical protein